MKTPIVALHGVQALPRPSEHSPKGATAERFDASTARLTQALGLEKMGVNVTVVAPGRAAYPFHSHRANDELFLVLAGQGELRLGSARHAVKEGDLIGCPAGDASSAHQLLNTGSTALRYLAISTAIDPEVCEHPDSGKIAAYAGHGDGDGDGGLYHMSRRAAPKANTGALRREGCLMSRQGDLVDYWLGE